jgi:hypothetical protein
MNVRKLKDNFALIKARLMVEPARELWQAPKAARLEVRKDHRGEYFHLMIDALRVLSMEVLKVDSADGMIVLAVRQRAFGRMNEAPRQLFVADGNHGSLRAHEIVAAQVEPQFPGAPSRN